MGKTTTVRSILGLTRARGGAISFRGRRIERESADRIARLGIDGCGFEHHLGSMKAALDGLDAVKGDLSGGQAKYREALSKMVLKTPVGDVRLDANRQAIGTTFITEVAKDAQGGLYNKVLRKIDGVNQLLGMKKEEFKIGSRDEPNCP